MSLSELKRAIEAQKPISFTYNKPGKTPGVRVGNPHAVWVMRRRMVQKAQRYMWFRFQE